MIVCLILISFLQAGSVEFSRTYGEVGSDRGVSIITTNDSSYLIVGNAENSEKDLDVYAIKLNSAGEVIWKGYYGGQKEDNGWSVLETADAYVIGGYTKSYGAVNYDILLLKLDKSGNEVWSRTYGGMGDDIAWSLKSTADGNFLLAAETDSQGAGLLDALLLCVSSEGDSLWSRTYGSNQNDRVFSLDISSQGEIVLAGITYSYGAGDRDAWLVKTDHEGNLLWQKTYGGAGYDNAHHVIFNKTDNIILTGYGDHFSTAGQWDIFLKEINPSGDERWSKTFGTEIHDRGINVIQTDDQGYLVTGFSHSDKGESRAIVVKVDTNGAMNWQKSFESGLVNIGYSSTQDLNGDFVLTGHTSNGNESDVWVVKFR